MDMIVINTGYSVYEDNISRYIFRSEKQLKTSVISLVRFELLFLILLVAF